MNSFSNLHIDDLTTDASVIDTTEAFDGPPGSLVVPVQQRNPGGDGDADSDSDDENDNENDDEDDEDETVDDDDDVTLATIHPGQ